MTKQYYLDPCFQCGEAKGISYYPTIYEENGRFLLRCPYCGWETSENESLLDSIKEWIQEQEDDEKEHYRNEKREQIAELQNKINELEIEIKKL